ncbi:Argininosuccinate lyase, chloroplastic [Vitis vinifera]|uniref:Argininosuccinate lyase, chloroplastic n=1 Tax=Vitis vinifera TaxID=29760 RepID=A0A438F8L2_VITVI|nr:Argininosuccinate lyase, chloroplastic [Vitis vinifera]
MLSYWLLSLTAKWDLSLPLIWGSPLGASHKSVMVWTEWKSGCGRDLPCGRGSLFLKVEESLSFRALWRACLSTLCPYCKGGLGIRNLSTLNRALLCKWSWRFAVERDSYWKLIIGTKYGVERGGWSTRGVREGYGWGFGRKSVRKIFGAGTFPLLRLSLLVDLAVSKYAWVVDYWDSIGEEGGWTPRFLRPFNDWEVEKVERFLSSIQGKRLNADVEDRMVWKETKNEIFTVKSLYNSLVYSCAVPFPWNIIWSRCSLCCAEEETINHILVHCSKAKVLWDLVFSLFSVNWVLPFTVRDTLLGWYVSFKDKKHRKVALVTLAMKNENLIVPGYTHLQRAQPILLQHLLLALSKEMMAGRLCLSLCLLLLVDPGINFNILSIQGLEIWGEKLDRDAGRLLDCRQRLNFCPLGACALAGTGLPIDRFMTSHDLGFNAPMRNREDKDKMVWTTSKSGAFSVKLLYSILEPGGSSLFPCGSIWRANVPPKVAFFAWEASWGKILTLEQLQRRGRGPCGIFFSRVAWVLSGSVKETLLGNIGSMQRLKRSVTLALRDFLVQAMLWEWLSGSDGVVSSVYRKATDCYKQSWLPIYFSCACSEKLQISPPSWLPIYLRSREANQWTDFLPKRGAIMLKPLRRHYVFIDFFFSPLVSLKSRGLPNLQSCLLLCPSELPPPFSSLSTYSSSFSASSDLSASFPNHLLLLLVVALKVGLAKPAKLPPSSSSLPHHLPFQTFLSSSSSPSFSNLPLQFRIAIFLCSLKVSDRDFVLEFLSANSITAIHLSRLEENPDPMNWSWKSARVVGDLVTLLVLCKGLPHAYNRDLQGIPFRTSHDIVGKSVALCVSKNCQLQDLSLDELRSVNPVFDEDVYEFLGVENAVKKFCSYGSTGSECVAEQLDFWVTKLQINTAGHK